MSCQLVLPSEESGVPPNTLRPRSSRSPRRIESSPRCKALQNKATMLVRQSAKAQLFSALNQRDPDSQQQGTNISGDLRTRLNELKSMLPDYKSQHSIDDDLVVKEEETEQSYSLDLSEITNVNVKTETDEFDLAADL